MTPPKQESAENRPSQKPREALTLRTAGELGDHADAVNHPILENAEENLTTPEKWAEAVGVNQDAFLAKLEQARLSFVPEVGPGGTLWNDVTQAFGSQDHTTAELQDMMKNLIAPIPRMGENSNTPYLVKEMVTIKQAESQPDYHMTNRLRNDINHVKEFIGINRAQQEATGTNKKLSEQEKEMLMTDLVKKQEVLERMLQKMETYAAQDSGRMNGYALLDGRNNRRTAESLGKMGKILGILLVGTAALFVGVGAIASRKKSAGPLLFVGLSALAVPDIRKMIFSSQHESALSEMNTEFNNPSFRNMAKANNMEGKPWEMAAMNLHDASNPTIEVLAGKIKNGTASEEERMELADLMFGGSQYEIQHKNFENLTKNPKAFDSFYRLGAIKDPDVREVGLAYIREGCSKYDNDVKILEEAESMNTAPIA